MAVAVSNQWWVYLVLGVATGLLSGTLGVGGGIIMIPVMVLLLGLGQKSAQGISLAVMVPLALVGAFRYWRMGGFDVSWGFIALMAAGAVVGTLISTEYVGKLSNETLRVVFAIFLVGVGVRRLFPDDKRKATPPADPPGQSAPAEPGGGADTKP
jgi:uncharacterized protein